MGRRARVNHVTAKEAEEATDVVLGNLFVTSILAKVLFDSGASHSFISQSFSSSNDVPFEKMDIPVLVQQPGSKWLTKEVSLNNEILIGNLPFQASLIALCSSDIDVILGMDWLVANKAFIDCTAKFVKLTILLAR